MIRYFANIRIPTEKAHGIQIMEMCSAFTSLGQEITLYVADRHREKKDPFAVYGLQKNFKIIYLPVIDLISLPLPKILKDLGFLIEQASYVLSSLFVKVDVNDIIYTREKLVVFALSILHPSFTIMYEAHETAKTTWLDRYVAKHANQVIVITRSIEESWKKLHARTIYAPDGVSEKFFKTISKQEARKKLDLLQDKRIIVYTGNFYPWKGVDTLLEAAQEMSELEFYFIGGEKETRYKTLKTKHNSRNIHFIGNRPYQEIPTWLKAADVLVIPNSTKTAKGSKDTSPLKLFEYLASGTSIVASRVPGIAEIVGDSDVAFFMPDNPNSLQETIKKVLNNSHTSSSQGKLAERYTWDNRAKKILELFK